MPTAFFLSRLRKDVNPTDYENWVQDVDYPVSSRFASIKSYKVHRISGAMGEGEMQKKYDYIEVVEFSDLDAYRKDLKSLEGRKLTLEWSKYIAESDAMHGQVI